jgi:hypothetical protein
LIDQRAHVGDVIHEMRGSAAIGSAVALEHDVRGGVTTLVVGAEDAVATYYSERRHSSAQRRREAGEGGEERRGVFLVQGALGVAR